MSNLSIPDAAIPVQSKGRHTITINLDDGVNTGHRVRSHRNGKVRQLVKANNDEAAAVMIECTDLSAVGMRNISCNLRERQLLLSRPSCPLQR